MHIYCDHCGFKRYYTGALDQRGTVCQVCGIGVLRGGQPDQGFTLNRAFQAEPQNLPFPVYQPVEVGTMATPGVFNYFAGVTGQAYQSFVQQNSCYVGKFTNLLVPQSEQFAWLTPYTGNKHNRTHFTQLLLSRVAQAKLADNRGVLPRLIEPFVGSGQIFLNSAHWGTHFTGGVPLFKSIVAGDLNHYVIGSYWTMRRMGDRFVTEYLKLAKVWDDHLDDNFVQLLQDLQTGKVALRNAEQDPATAMLSCLKYIWLVNRCVHGSKLNQAGAVVATCKARTSTELTALRAQEQARLGAVRDKVVSLQFAFECRDFRYTCALAEPGDIVFMDCPFPVFSNSMVPSDHPEPAKAGSASANTYGTGDDGADFQKVIVDVARELVDEGVTVILCNFANPGLVHAYQQLLPANLVPGAQRRQYTFTYRSPATSSEAYQLTIVPGKGNAAVAAATLQLLAEWHDDGGDDAAVGEFFAHRDEAMDEEDATYLAKYAQQEQQYEDEDSDYNPQ